MESDVDVFGRPIRQPIEILLLWHCLIGHLVDEAEARLPQVTMLPLLAVCTVGMPSKTLSSLDDAVAVPETKLVSELNNQDDLEEEACSRL